MKLRAIMLSLLALASAACSAQAEDAADYPSKKIKMLLPFGAGGGGDVLGRLLADRMGKRLGQTIFIENRTGAAGTIGAQQAATAAADGYTITIGGMTTHVLAPAVYPNLPYDPIGGHISVGLVDMATGTPLVKDGKLKALAVCGGRSPSLPEVASYKEQGVDFERSLSWVMYAPAGIPASVTQKISGALKASLAEPDIVEKLLALGISAEFIAGDQQRDINARDIEAW